jgi:nitroreductase
MPDLFETIETTRAMRRLKPDPVPDELIAKILKAGVCAANGGNTQRWRFLVIKDTAIKKKVQVWYKRAFDETVGPRYLKSAPPPGVTRERYDRQHAAVEYLTDHFHEAPVWIVACIDSPGQDVQGAAPPGRSAGASIYPAVQNMLLAARALGLGATLTTRHLLYEKESEAALGLPPGVHSYAIIPIGYPMGNFGPVGRGPLKEIVYQDQWGSPYLGVS